MPDVREKLVELIQNEEFMCHDRKCEECKHISTFECLAHCIADTLISNGVTIQRWIPVTERLPETFATVLIYTGSKVHEAFLQKDRKWLAVFGDSLIIESSDVTHWMPLPEPPEEE